MFGRVSCGRRDVFCSAVSRVGVRLLVEVSWHLPLFCCCVVRYPLVSSSVFLLFALRAYALTATCFQRAKSTGARLRGTRNNENIFYMPLYDMYSHTCSLTTPHVFFFGL